MYIGRAPFIEQLNDISFWYPVLNRIGMRTPKTLLFYAPHEIGKVVDGEQTPEFSKLVRDVANARHEFGGEAFLRTGQTSNKHEWRNTCHLTIDSKVGWHLARLIEFSMLVDLPYTTFAVREMIKTKPLTTAFHGMPIAREVRMFADRGKVICAHPYWPDEAFKDQPIKKEELAALQEMPDMAELNKMAEYVSDRFDGAWSIDFLQDDKGDWWLTDMALARTSYHWPECENKDKWPD